MLLGDDEEKPLTLLQADFMDPFCPLGICRHMERGNRVG